MYNILYLECACHDLVSEMNFSPCSNDSRNTEFDDPYSLKYHIETSAVAIDSPNESVSVLIQNYVKCNASRQVSSLNSFITHNLTITKIFHLMFCENSILICWFSNKYSVCS